MKIYIAGKITGDPEYRSKFNYAERKLKAAGYTVMNPAILPDGFEYDEYISMSAALMAPCDTICLLPGWEKSRGATNEFYRAYTRGMDSFYFDVWLKIIQGREAGERVRVRELAKMGAV